MTSAEALALCLVAGELLDKLPGSLGFQGLLAQCLSAIQAAPGSGIHQVWERCVPAAAWVNGTQLHGFHLEKAAVWQPLLHPSDSLGMGLGTPGSLSGYWKEKMSAWQLKGPKKWESQLLSNLEKLNIVLMGFLSHFLSVKNALISGLLSKTE